MDEVINNAGNDRGRSGRTAPHRHELLLEIGLQATTIVGDPATPATTRSDGR
ncbi:hypothetical protein KIF24_29665 [Micromonospora sp. Llam7]|uniref:hypothetical protein n=1 Tax=Micromonospora tarapacensis TaxID=2835305 RepID=UPI001C83ACA6|nr:hypothetical protein [Micromonospora tarapacensis]MBX7269775.1 hypothetical protein [Micromonospora tarapacensis]